MTDKKILYIDMDNTLVDFSARLTGIDPAILEAYKDRGADEIPGIFAVMPPVKDAMSSFRTLAESIDTYILSTAPWNSPSAWQHKIEWVHLHLGIDEDSPTHKRLILSHHKDLNRGDFLVDDRHDKNGADGFQGELVHFGSAQFPDWESVTNHLLAWA